MFPWRENQRVELIHTNDAHTALKPGERGTITFIDDLGTVFVNWDNGDRLGVVESAGDRIRLLTE